MKTTIVIASDRLGRGDDELGGRLMGNFVRKLWASPAKPASIVFYNAGVLLLAEGSPVLDALDGLAASGVDLVACGTCIAHFGLDATRRVGRVSDMQEIVGIMTDADKVVTV